MFSYCRNPGLCLLVVITGAIFVWLGTWQLNRAQEKELLVAQIEERQTHEPIVFPTGANDYSEYRYTPVLVSGKYNPEQQFLLDNQVKDRTVGYNVLTPVKLANSDASVLVDRGWVPQGQTRVLLPDVSFESLTEKLEGIIYVPYGKGFVLGGFDEGQAVWPRVIQYIDFEAMSERLERPLIPAIVRLSPTEPEGYRREWRNINMGADKHLGYAVQWYALALAMLVILIILIVKRDTV